METALPRWRAVSCFILMLFAAMMLNTRIRHNFPGCRGGNRRTALARVTGISPLRGSLRAAPTKWFSMDRSIITRLPMRVGLARNQPQCETARHRLLFGRMGTAQHLHWPSLMQILSAQVVLAHPPASLQPPFLGGISSADVSRCRIFSFQGTHQSYAGSFLPCMAGKFCEDALHNGQIFTFQVYHELSKQDFLLW